VNQDPQNAGREERRRQQGDEVAKLKEMHQDSEGRRILARTHAIEDSYYVFWSARGS
jgi:hypothetical protein